MAVEVVGAADRGVCRCDVTLVLLIVLSLLLLPVHVVGHRLDRLPVRATAPQNRYVKSWFIADQMPGLCPWTAWLA